MAHSEAEVEAAHGGAPKGTLGSASMAFFLSPLGGGCCSLSPLEAWRPRQAQRETTRPRPRTQTSAQRKEARMTNKSESTGGCSVAAAWRRSLAGARMLLLVDRRMIEDDGLALDKSVGLFLASP